MGHIITRTKEHVKTTPFTAEESFRNDVLKDKTPEAHWPDKLIDHYTKIYEQEELKSMIQSIMTLK